MIDVLYDIAPAVHQGAGLARYAERRATHLLQGQSVQVNLRFFCNRHSGHLLPPALRTVPAVTLSLGQLAWRLNVLASQLDAANVVADIGCRQAARHWRDVCARETVEVYCSVLD